MAVFCRYCGKKAGCRIAGLTFVAVVALVCYLAVSFTGYKGLLRKVMRAYEAYDMEGLLSLSSGVYDCSEEDAAELYFEPVIREKREACEALIGRDYRFSYEIKEVHPFSERERMERLEKIKQQDIGFDAGCIEKIMAVRLEATAQRGETAVKHEVVVTMTRENGRWALLELA